MELGKGRRSTITNNQFLITGKLICNKQVSQTKARATKVYRGCCKMGEEKAVVKFYPKGAKEAYCLHKYVKQCNSIIKNYSL